MDVPLAEALQNLMSRSKYDPRFGANGGQTSMKSLRLPGANPYLAPMLIGRSPRCIKFSAAPFPCFFEDLDRIAKRSGKP
jgi:hypothetical protein